jgi:hypothetical protein
MSFTALPGRPLTSWQISKQLHPITRWIFYSIKDRDIPADSIEALEFLLAPIRSLKPRASRADVIMAAKKLIIIAARHTANPDGKQAISNDFSLFEEICTLNTEAVAASITATDHLLFCGITTSSWEHPVQVRRAKEIATRRCWMANDIKAYIYVDPSLTTVIFEVAKVSYMFLHQKSLLSYSFYLVFD